MLYLLSALLILALGVIGFLCWKLYTFARIIMVFEDDISDSIKSLEDVEASLANVLEMKLFFDNQEIKMVVSDVMERVKIAKFNVNQMTLRFTDRSKRKFYFIEEENPLEIPAGEIETHVVENIGTIPDVQKTNN